MRHAVLLTAGHGTLPAEAFAALLTSAGVQRLVDARRFPGSRRHPHFSRDALIVWLVDAGVDYRWEADLGGRRAAQPQSPHHALREASFRGYADWMETDAFKAAFERLLTDARTARTAVLCAESVWWRCHRRLIADAAVLLAHIPVEHLGHNGRLVPHQPTAGVRRDGDRLVYDVTGTLPPG